MQEDIFIQEFFDNRKRLTYFLNMKRLKSSSTTYTRFYSSVEL
jgi:hypothetical protein